ncbi:MAG: hypothetical protein AAFO95_06065 [Cyanobacteria bacterium J06600_6]
MGQQNGFGSGFILGSIVGGVVGGVLGTILSTQKEKQLSEAQKSELQSSRIGTLNTEESIELARHSLEDKIAQLNLAIDDVKDQLGTVKTFPEQE